MILRLKRQSIFRLAIFAYTYNTSEKGAAEPVPPPL
jgi:hypothetical protein